ncbi:hypothetical protein PT974_00127 [Cladobotryum mycophilum]|uniref:HNH nuclease domain-containing protein n=1 Tax=Cladobotryum mycophilum TaxID=491253 RepID=A0ABR0SZY4_9HYPO
MVDDMIASSPSVSSSSNGNGDKPSPSPSSSPVTTPSTTQTRRPQKSSPASPSGVRKRCVRRPAKGSLFGLLGQNAGTSLFVRPICWTDLHAKLLGARFEELPPCDTPLPCNVPGSPPTQGHLQPSPTITILSDALSEILQPSAVHPILSSNAVKTTLMTLWPTAFSKPQLLPELHIFFGGKVYHDAVRVQAMWNFTSEGSRASSQSSFKTVSTRPTDSHQGILASSPGIHNLANLPMLCYIGKNQLASIRRNLFRVAPGPGKSWNAPVFRLQQLRAKALVPADSDHDAHFVGIFLAMAQRHFYASPTPSVRRESYWSPRKGKPPRPNFQDLKLRILTHDNDTSDFLVYTGHVTAQFLDRFHNPYGNPCDDEDSEVPGIKIEYTRVPIWPILGLRERLGKALGEDIVGPFDPENMETWEEDEAEKKNRNRKRKREALAQVFNGSFDEESDGEQQEMGEKKDV